MTLDHSDSSGTFEKKHERKAQWLRNRTVTRKVTCIVPCWIINLASLSRDRRMIRNRSGDIDFEQRSLPRDELNGAVNEISLIVMTYEIIGDDHDDVGPHGSVPF